MAESEFIFKNLGLVIEINSKNDQLPKEATKGPVKICTSCKVDNEIMNTQLQAILSLLLQIIPMGTITLLNTALSPTTHLLFDKQFVIQ
jgi:hypothetical protein